MKINQVCSFAGIIFLLIFTGCADKTNSDRTSGEPADAATQAAKKTVIQDLCWSPDGRYVYFSAMKVKPDFSDYAPELWTIYRLDTQTQKTATVVKSAVYVAVSPDGKQIVVSKNIGKTRNIYLLDKDGNNPRPLVTGEAKTFGPSWAPDGSRLAFSGTQSGQAEIYIANRDGSNVKRLTDSQGHNAYNPAWSPDGAHIAYYLEKGDGADQIHVMKADGTEDRNITNDTFNNIFPDWIDNKTIIYGQGHKDAPTKTYQVSIDGTAKRQVLQLESGYARYSPDSSKIAYLDEKERDINVITATGKLLYQITVPD